MRSLVSSMVYSTTRWDNLIPANFHLTERELECLSLTLAGLSATEISDYLHVSSRTVEHHLERIKDKLCVRKKSELIAYAFILQGNPSIEAKMQKTIEEYLSIFSKTFQI